MQVSFLCEQDECREKWKFSALQGMVTEHLLSTGLGVRPYLWLAHSPVEEIGSHHIEHPNILGGGLSDSCLLGGLPGNMLFALSLGDDRISADGKGILGRRPCPSSGWEAKGPHMPEEWVWLGQYLEAIWLRALKAEPRSEAHCDEQQACGVSWPF